MFMMKHKILTVMLLSLNGCQLGLGPAGAAPEGSSGAPAPIQAKALATQAVTAALVQREPAAVDRYFAPNYIQHSSLAADGPQALKDLVTSLRQNANYSYTPIRVIAEGPLVLFHGRYTGFGDTALVAFDLFRVENGKIAEHWDGLQPQADKTVSGRTQLDGSTQTVDLDRTAQNKALVSNFLQDVLVGGKFDKLSTYISTEQYLQHNPDIGDGLDGLGQAVAAMGKAGITMTYQSVHQVLAEGNFVFALSEGSFGGKPTAYYDLFRVEKGKIVEHWDVMRDIPAQLPHKNGLF